MTGAEVIEGTAREVEPESALVVVDPARGLARPETPTDMVRLASQMATALKDIVERQRLYAVIQGKKYPQVEAWMTVARMDNVVAREVIGGIARLEDGAYEATVELVRLSDGMVVGRGSALCGSHGDSPWDKRPEPARRSMAVTRATSRAFRQQYSWIMALAGYEPTPAEEMPRDEAPVPHEAAGRPVAPAAPRPAPTDGMTGRVAVGKPPVDCEVRQTPDGDSCGFSLETERGKVQVLAMGQLATALSYVVKDAIGKQVTVHGRLEMVPWTNREGREMPPYRRLHLERIEGPDFAIPAAASPAPVDDLEDLKW